jgi:hypothetical protein
VTNDRIVGRADIRGLAGGNVTIGLAVNAPLTPFEARVRVGSRR